MDRQADNFAWPDLDAQDYSDLAAFLARLNEMSFDDVLGMNRANGKSANHQLDIEDLSDEGRTEWERFYAQNALDEGEDADLVPITVSYCLGHGDGRRVVLALNSERRRMFPLWWDPAHLVSGTDGGTRGPTKCVDECLHNRELSA